MKKKLAPILTLLLLAGVGVTQWIIRGRGASYEGPPAGGYPDSELQLVEYAVGKACVDGDAGALWTLFSDRLRAEAEREATRMRGFGDSEVLKEGWGYSGPIDGFDGRALLAGNLRRGAAFNPCHGAERWQFARRDGAGDQRQAVYLRPDGYLFAMRFERLAGRWTLDEITQPVPLEAAGGTSGAARQ
jgi:hypothetical protein